MKVLVTGCRNWNRWDVIETAMKWWGKDTILVHGGARGADRMAGAMANFYGFKNPPIVHSVNDDEWRTHGLGAGHERNRKMYDIEQPDMVVGFWDGQSSGTSGMLHYALAQGAQKVVVYYLKEPPKPQPSWWFSPRLEKIKV